jgi:hypothetical protein
MLALRRPAQPVTERPGGTPDVGDSGGAIDVRRQREIDVRVRLDPVQRLADMKKRGNKGRKARRARTIRKKKKGRKKNSNRYGGRMGGRTKRWIGRRMTNKKNLTYSLFSSRDLGKRRSIFLCY